MTTASFPVTLFKRFHRLQWKLTISYLLTSVIVLCLMEMLVLFISMILFVSNDHATLVKRTQLLARIVTSSQAPASSRQQQLQAAWALCQESDSTFRGYIATVDASGKVVSVAGDYNTVLGQDLLPDLPVTIQHNVQDVLSPSSISTSNAMRTLSDQDRVYIVAPLSGSLSGHEALVIQAQYMRTNLTTGLNILLFFGVSALVFFFGAGVVGLAFGVVTARGLVKRLQRIVTAVDGWSQGDFSTFVRDRSNDELGQLARRLNYMAQQLQRLLRTRQDLATLQERNRLARDLHDSVKQQVFAASLQVSTARALVERDTSVAKTHLASVERLVRQAQRELTTLIHELRPVALEGRSLAEAVRTYVNTWQEQTSVSVVLELSGDEEPSPALEDALFRIVQEGLANVARHSQATEVTLCLDCNTTVTFSLRDNGKGFAVRERDSLGIGLSSMRERIQVLGGDIEIQSEIGKGTTIIVQCDHTASY
ncbi:sensor histidine kinase [Ktedonospora formicarum]|uniref:Oxygen sensor histidine kinase NreB n=1 Tax=Ktedonospora formicarum TaxID=2778364 RepID=A0A8J3MU43_9CHLR|nr:sensor histidine kinase [Ktedonospora formicarum]GHO46556.1 hypothetical protein KSX_47190 [Ktedonospora formicarum]